MKKIIIFLLLMAMSCGANSGINGLTIHSRANCVNNESITWDARWYRIYRTVSSHQTFDGKQYKVKHVVDTLWEDTWRSAAVHWGEANPGSDWQVVGWHWITDRDTGEDIFLGNTSAADCNIYDGWWDTNANRKI